jgi:2-succinyl-6-hydroxy-2,4-cyclohexadiene-1-carboxylate synthase
MIWTLHGAVGRSADWLEFAASMRYETAGVGSECCEVRRLDLWRFLDCCPMPLSEVGAVLAGQIRRIDPDPVLVGYSMGGRLALHALLAEPKMWKAAVIVSAHPGLADEIERAERRLKDAEWSAMALKGAWSEFLEKWESQGVLEGAGDMPDRRVLKDRRASVARSFIDWSLGAQEDLSQQLDRIECPVLWVTGERDVKFTELAKAAVSRIPHADHHVVSESGHRVPWERPEAFVALCRKFLEEK